jgi:solute:Na+ symporter, SSS family
MLLACIIAYALITVIIGIVASRLVKNVNDFALAGRRLPLVVSASAFFATWFGAETVLGASSEFTEGGLISVIEDPFGAALCLLLVGLFFARPLYRMNILSLGDFYRNRFGRRAELISSVFMIVSFFGWTAAQFVAFGTVLDIVTGAGVTEGIAIGAAIVIVYTVTGGMWAVSLTDLVQTVVIIAGLLAVAILLVHDAGGIGKVIDRTPGGFFNMLPEGSFSSWMEYIAAWITIGLGSIASQDVFQRVMATRSERTAVRSAWLGSIMYLTIAFIPLLIGLCARILYPELIAGDPQRFLPLVVMEHSAVWVQALFFGALLSAIMSSASAGVLAPATILAENIIRPFFPGLSQSQLLSVFRLSVVFIALCSVALSFFRQNIYELVAESSALTLVSLFVPLAAGIYIRRANTAGALLSMLLGLAAWIVFQACPFGFPAILAGFIASIAGMAFGIIFSPRLK